MAFTEWISSSVGTTVVLAILGYFARHWIIERLTNSIKHEYETELETHKADLRRDYGIQIEKLRAELAERTFRFSHVFEHTEMTIRTVYVKLLAVLDAALLASPELPSKEDREKAVRAAFDKFYAFYRPNKIYIPKDSAKRIDDFCSNVSTLVYNYRKAEQLETVQLVNEKRLLKVYTQIEDIEFAIPTLLSALEDDFQILLGFPIQDKTAAEIKT